MTTELARPTDFFNIDNMKSYATEENLIKALNKCGTPAQVRHCLVVCNRSGRFTAIVPVGVLDGNLTAFPGFMKMG